MCPEVPLGYQDPKNVPSCHWSTEGVSLGSIPNGHLGILLAPLTFNLCNQRRRWSIRTLEAPLSYHRNIGGLDLMPFYQYGIGLYMVYIVW